MLLTPSLCHKLLHTFSDPLERDVLHGRPLRPKQFGTASPHDVTRKFFPIWTQYRCGRTLYLNPWTCKLQPYV